MSEDTESSKYYPYWLRDAEGNLDEELAREFDVERDALIERIEAAFADVLYPEGDILIAGEDPDSMTDKQAMREAFSGKHWSEIPLDTVVEYRHSLQVFSPEGYRFYLPPFMIKTLIHYGEVDLLPTKLIVSLAGQQFFGHKLPKLIEKFSAVQRVAVLEFLNFYYLLLDKIGMSWYRNYLEEAIEYWEKYQHGDSR